MVLQIRITTKDEAAEAVNMLRAYIGTQDTEAEVEAVVGAKKAPAKKKAPIVKKEEAPLVGKEEEPKEEEPKEESSIKITSTELTKEARAAVGRTDRATVKEVISKYGAKISVVDEGDYEALMNDLRAL